ncbi:MAG: adenylate/guanylate cyclase domain-containing response regulator, partial [Spirochaetota bacterium]
LYELLEEKAFASPRQQEALEMFEGGDWEKAQEHFKRVLQLVPDDGPSQLYLKRIRKFQSKEPPQDWDGVFNLSLK